MVLIHGTNILVDDFDFNRPRRAAYIHFLTHFHPDHYRGLNEQWTDERIYCSPVTERLLLDKFPHLTQVTALPLNDEHMIYIDQEKAIYVFASLFDSNHCVGAVMILFKGYMGNILHTGDFRWSAKMLEEIPELYPDAQRNISGDACSISIDEVVLDDTFCDPVFKFPKRNKAYKAIVHIIDSHRDQKICIAVDTIGKEELLVHLATHYDSQIVVDANKYKVVSLAEYYRECFTTDPQSGFIYTIKKSQIKQNLKKGAVVIVPTGWCNQLSVEIESNYFIVGYSLHSNYEEITAFVKSIRPGKITSTHIRPQQNILSLRKLKLTNLNPIQCYRNMKQNGLTILEKEFCSRSKFSELYKTYLKLKNLKAIQKELGISEQAPVRNPIDIMVKSEPKSSATKDSKRSVNKSANKETFCKILDEEQKDDQVKLEGEYEDEESELPEEEEEEPVPYESSQQEVNEAWQRAFMSDQNLFKKGGKTGFTEEEQIALENIMKQPQDYFPFSDASEGPGSDNGEEEMETEFIAQTLILETQAANQDSRGTVQISRTSTLGADKPKGPESYKLYSGTMELTIPVKNGWGETTLKEGFAMYTPEGPVQFEIPENLNFQDIVPYTEVEPLVKEAVEEKKKDSKRDVVVGWIESEKKEEESLFKMLADHMKEHNYARRYKVDEKVRIYFMHHSQMKRKVRESTHMVFLIVVMSD